MKPLSPSDAAKHRNREAVLASNLKQRPFCKQATPPWYGELDDFVLLEALRLARLRTEMTGRMWHVDHMFPFKATRVSGLHVWNNLQVIPASLNTHKRNLAILTQPGEWINYAIPKGPYGSFSIKEAV